MSKKQRITVLLTWVLAVILSCVAIYITFINRGYTEVAFLDVGQGDACFIQTEKLSSVLIDGGDKGSGNYVIEPFLMSKSERCIDAVFLSHMHSDHISGIMELIESDIEIKHIYVSKYAETEDGFFKLKNKASDRNIPITVLWGGEVVPVDNVTFKVIDTGEHKYTDQNDMSMVLRFDCGKTSILFTGDLTNNGERDIINDKNIDTDILKVAHHGSEGSSNLEFLNKVTADLFVISVGENNRYHHPSLKTMGILNSLNKPILRTDYDRTISLIMTDNDIKNIDFYREREL